MRTTDAIESITASAPNPRSERLPLVTANQTATDPATPLQTMLRAESWSARRRSFARGSTGALRRAARNAGSGRPR